MLILLEIVLLGLLFHSWTFSDCFSSLLFKSSNQYFHLSLPCSFERYGEKLKIQLPQPCFQNSLLVKVHKDSSMKKKKEEQFLIALAKIQPSSMSVKWMTSLLHGILDVAKVLKNSKQPSPYISRLYWNWPEKYKP